MNSLFRFTCLHNESFKNELLGSIGALENEHSIAISNCVDCLWQVGICIPCIYRVLHDYINFEIKPQVQFNHVLKLIKLEVQSQQYLFPIQSQKTNNKDNLVTEYNKSCFICNDLFVKIKNEFDNSLQQLVNNFEFDSYKTDLQIPSLFTIRELSACSVVICLLF